MAIAKIDKMSDLSAEPDFGKLFTHEGRTYMVVTEKNKHITIRAKDQVMDVKIVATPIGLISVGLNSIAYLNGKWMIADFVLPDNIGGIKLKHLVAWKRIFVEAATRSAVVPQVPNTAGLCIDLTGDDD